MTDQADSQLLRAYVEHRSEPAFAELVRRHIDLVYSAALRMVCDSHLAEDVSQSVFVALAKNAAQLTCRPVLSGWLHRTAQHIAAQTVRTDVRRRAREQEAVAMNELLSAGSDMSWEHIAPHLDTALGELSEPDRDAVLLRYFEKKSAQEMAERLGISDEAAQKRVNRAVERLREFFAKRGVTVGASGLVVVISANAVQAAPAGLAATISTVAAVAGTTIAATATATITKAIAMTTLQKTIVTATVAVLAGVGIYETIQTSSLQEQVQSFKAAQAPWFDQIRQLQRERDVATSRLASVTGELTTIKSNTAELPKLRGEVALLRQDSQELPRLKAKLNQFEDRQAAQMKSFREQQEQEAFVMLQRMKAAIKLAPGQEQALQELLLKRADLIVRDVQAFSDGNEKMFGEQFSQSMSNVTAQIDAVFSAEQQADYKAFQQSGKAVGARLRAAGEMMMVQQLVGIGAEQQDQVYSLLYNLALKRKPDDSSDDPEIANALATVLTSAQMEQYRKFVQGKRISTQISYPTE